MSHNTDRVGDHIGHYLLVVGSLVLLSLAANWWILDRDNFFELDDFSHFRHLETTAGQPLFTFLPQSSYNDRPIGWMLIRYMRDNYGWDHTGHHFILWSIHLLNATLVYVFALNLFWFLENNDRSQGFAAWLAAALFIAWPTSTLAPSWDAAVFDLLGATFLLCFLIAALAANDRQRLPFYACVMAATLWVGLRTKEMLIVTPFLAVVIGFVARWTDQRRHSHAQLPAFVKPAAALCLVSVFYFLMLRLIDARQPFAADPSNPYFQSFSPKVFAANAFKYLALFFDAGIPDNIATMPVGARWLYYTLPVVLGAGAIWQVAWYQRLTIAACCSLALLQLLPVLPMVNMQHRLYLYLPSVFAVCGIAAGLVFLLERLPCARAVARVGLAILVPSLLVAGVYFSEVHTFRHWWLEIGHANRTVFPRVFDLPRFPADSQIAVINVPAYMRDVNLFAQDGDLLRLLGSDDSISVRIYSKDEPPNDSFGQSPPTHIIDYNNGQIRLVDSPPSSAH